LERVVWLPAEETSPGARRLEPARRARPFENEMADLFAVISDCTTTPLQSFQKRTRWRSVAEWMQAIAWTSVRDVGQNSARPFLTPQFLSPMQRAAAAVDRAARLLKILLAGES
jgi:hypothetical protein